MEADTTPFWFNIVPILFVFILFYSLFRLCRFIGRISGVQKLSGRQRTLGDLFVFAAALLVIIGTGYAAIMFLFYYFGALHLL